MAKRVPRNPRPPRTDLVDAVVLEVYGLVHDQGWLADRALERALRRERKIWASERRLAAESLYGLLRMQGQLDFLLAGVEPGAPASGVALQARYAAWLVRFAGVAADEAAARLAVPRSALRSLAGADQRIAAVLDGGAVRGRAGRGRGARAGARAQRSRPAHGARQPAARRPRGAARAALPG